MESTHVIDVWEGESIWTWEGVASSTEGAQQAAMEELNSDWDRAYTTWREVEQDMSGTAHSVYPAVMGKRLPLATLQAIEAFLCGFEDDDAQEGVGDMLRTLRDAIGEA